MPHELFKITDLILEKIVNSIGVDVSVIVNQEISKAGHAANLLGEILGKNSFLSHFEQDIPVVCEIFHALGSQNVGTDIQDVLDRELERMFCCQLFFETRSEILL